MNKAIAIGLVIAGAVMLVIGFSAKDSLASQTSELFHDAPSNKALVLLIGGAVCAIVGVIGLLRRPAVA